MRSFSLHTLLLMVYFFQRYLFLHYLIRRHFLRLIASTCPQRFLDCAYVETASLIVSAHHSLGTSFIIKLFRIARQSSLTFSFSSNSWIDEIVGLGLEPQLCPCAGKSSDVTEQSVPSEPRSRSSTQIVPYSSHFSPITLDMLRTKGPVAVTVPATISATQSKPKRPVLVRRHASSRLPIILTTAFGTTFYSVDPSLYNGNDSVGKWSRRGPIIGRRSE